MHYSTTRLFYLIVFNVKCNLEPEVQKIYFLFVILVAKFSEYKLSSRMREYVKLKW
jgi:hypothetical protein